MICFLKGIWDFCRFVFVPQWGSIDYASIKQQLIGDNRWNDDYSTAEAELEFCALPE